MIKARPLVKALGVLIIVVWCSSHDALGQSSLFSVPTTDVMATGEAYLEADFDSHLTSYESGGFQSYGAFALYGVGKRTEVGLNAYYVKAGGSPEPVELQPNAKWQVFEDEVKGVAAATGVILYVPITQRAGSDTFGSVYGTVSKKVNGLRGARFTAGAYTLIGLEAGSGSRNGGLFGYEQPLHTKVSFIADWITGKNRLGYAAAGLGITLSEKSVLYTGYFFGNEGRANNSLAIYYGITF